MGLGRASRLLPLLFVLGVALIFLTPSLAQAAPGDLSFVQCFDDDDADAEGAACVGLPGLDQVNGVAESSDGKSLYAVSEDGALVAFNRDATTGALSFAQCFDDTSAGTETQCPGVEGFGSGAEAVIASPDGKSVYVASDDGLLGFTRDPTTGVLTYAQCISEDVAIPSPTCPEVAGLGVTSDLALSPNGKSLYSASFSQDTVDHFTRDTSTGLLTFTGCTDDNDFDNEPTCPGVDGLDGVSGVAVSGDGKSVYAASFNDDAIVRFTRDLTSGVIGFGDCQDDDDTGPEAACPGVNGLGEADNVVVSPNDKSVYVGSSGDAAIAEFDRDTTTGVLSFTGCLDDNDSGPEPACPGVDGLAPRDLAVSSDGAALYAASATPESTLGRFDRDTTTGLLSFAQCLGDNDSSTEVACPGVDGLSVAWSVAVSPDGKSVYVGSRDGVAVFTNSPPATTGPEPSPPPTAGDTEPPNTTIDAGPKAKTSKKKASFAFSSSEPGSSFQCKLDKGTFEPCTSPAQVKVKPGKHVFEVRAIDAAGNSDPTPASDSWKAKKSH